MKRWWVTPRMQPFRLVLKMWSAKYVTQSGEPELKCSALYSTNCCTGNTEDGEKEVGTEVLVLPAWKLEWTCLLDISHKLS